MRQRPESSTALLPECAKDLGLVLGTNSTVNSIVPLGLLVKMRVHGISCVMKNECAKREKGRSGDASVCKESGTAWNFPCGESAPVLL